MEYTYSVAISFLSADLEVAREIRRALKARVSLPVFFYPDLQEVLAGGIYEEALSEPFEYQSRVSVVLFRPGWGKSGGTLVEYRALTRRRNRSDERFLFPVVIEQGAKSPPWAEDIIYYDLSRNGLSGAVAAIVRMLDEHEREYPAPPVSVPSSSAVNLPSPLVGPMSDALRSDFASGTGPLRGYFGAADGAEDSKRWQSKDGESRYRY